MGLSEENMITDLTSKYHVSAYGLMEHLGISYKSGKYYYQNTAYETYIQALMKADSTFSDNLNSHAYIKSIDTQSDKSTIKPETKLMNGLFLIGLIIWPLFVFVSFMMFDSPDSNNPRTILAAATIWSYPITYFIARSKSYSEALNNTLSNKSFYWSCLPMLNIFIFLLMIAL